MSPASLETTPGGTPATASSGMLHRGSPGSLLRGCLRPLRDPWAVTAGLLALIVSIPVLVILANLFSSPGENWQHIRQHTLPDYLKNTAILVSVAGSLSLLVGVPTAWLVASFHFPGRKVFAWALVLPLALPTYVAAYAYGDILQLTFPLQIWVKKAHGTDAFLVVESILRYGIVSLILASVLYPYVYLAARAAFCYQASSSIEVSRTLGHSMLSTFFRVALPMARPAIVAGLSLVIMEVINDYGAVSHFGIPTLTVGIFRTWLAMGDSGSAIRLAAGVMLFILVLLVAERIQRGNKAFFASGSRTHHTPLRKPLGRLGSIVAPLVCLLPLATGFFVPGWRLARWALQTSGKVLTPKFWGLIESTLTIAGTGTLAVVLGALLLSYAGRVSTARMLTPLTHSATLGYAVPGAVIAIGILLPLGWLDKGPVAWIGSRLGAEPSLFFSGTLFALGIAYLVRFLAVAYHPLKSGMERVCCNLDAASRLLGRSPFGTLLRINLPLLRGPLLAAAILVFVDVLKELPLTLVLRPFNFETLSTKAYSLASEGRLAECSVPSLLIVIAGMIGLVPLNRLMEGWRGK